MRKINLFIFASIFSLLITSCQGTREQELKKLDKVLQKNTIVTDVGSVKGLFLDKDILKFKNLNI